MLGNTVVQIVVLSAFVAVVALLAKAMAAKSAANALLATEKRREDEARALNQRLVEAQSLVRIREEQVSALKEQLKDAQAAVEQERSRFVAAAGQVQALQAEVEAKKARIAEIVAEQSAKMAELEERLNDKFQSMAAKILDEKTAKLNEEGVKSIRSVLEPFGVSLKELKESVVRCNDETIRSSGALSEQLKRLGQVNERLNAEAANLTNALKTNSQKQGRWGEVTLEMLLESAGLERGVVFVTQEQLKDELGENLKTDAGSKMRPDVVVKLPDGRRVVIDAKCSLTAFLTATDQACDESTRAKAMEEHVRSVKAHIDELAEKSYDKAPGSLDYVFMFIPSEAAYAAAMQADGGLWEYANRNRISMVCPMTLLAVLKVVNFMWTQQRQIDHVKRIVERGRLLYDKAAGFVETFQKMRSSLRAASDAADAAYGQLTSGRGNLVWQAEQLKQSDGIISHKSIAVRD